MNNLICAIICLLVGLLVYVIVTRILINCEDKKEDKQEDKKEGMATMGKVHLEKCCPFQYKWDKNKKQCVKICDGCDLETYGKIKYEILKQKIKSGPIEEVMEYYTCDDNDSKNVYNYKELSGIFNHGQITDQYNFTGAVVESDMDAVAASEERGNESWADVRIDAPKRKGKDDAQERSSNKVRGLFPFRGIDTSLYYMDEDTCKEEYKIYENNQNREPGTHEEIIKPSPCKGHWKLDLYDNNFKFLKDNPSHSGTSPFVVLSENDLTRKRGDEGNKSMLDILDYQDPELNTKEKKIENYYNENCDMINRLVVNIDNDSSPVGRHYKSFTDKYCNNGEANINSINDAFEPDEGNDPETTPEGGTVTFTETITETIETDQSGGDGGGSN